MNKQEWEECEDICKLLKQVKSNRKKQLFALACAKSVKHLMLDQSKDCLEKLELFIDGKINKKELALAKQAADSAVWAAHANANITKAMVAAANAVKYSTKYLNTVRVANAVATAYAGCRARVSEAIRVANAIAKNNAEDWCASRIAAANAAEHIERFKQAVFLKDIYNPNLLDLKFSDQAKAIAEQVYDGDDKARLVLSDYLEENNYPEELYLHLKQPTHYKGCWLIDQILGNS